MVHDICNARILPYTDHTLAHMLVQWRMRVRVYLIFQQVFGIFIVFGVVRLDLELPHSPYKGFGAVEHIFVDGKAVEGEFVSGVAVLMNDFHLLYNG